MLKCASPRVRDAACALQRVGRPKASPLYFLRELNDRLILYLRIWSGSSDCRRSGQTRYLQILGWGGALLTHANIFACSHAGLISETWLLSVKLQSSLTLIVLGPYLFLGIFDVVVHSIKVEVHFTEWAVKYIEVVVQYIKLAVRFIEAVF